MNKTEPTIGRHRPSRASARTEDDAGRPPRAALITRVLDGLHFRGWFFCLSELRAPWALALPGGRLAAVHAVLDGRCVLTVQGRRGSMPLAAGDIVVLPRDDLHTLVDRPGRRPQPIVAVQGLDRRDRVATSLHYGGMGAATRLLSASFVADTPAAAAIVAALPPALVLRAGTTATARVLPVLALIRGEAAAAGAVSATVLRRAAEVLFIQALREALLGVNTDGGWLGATSDPRLAAALLALHEQPERRWTLASLAQRAHLSRTAFFERFSAQLGQTPMEYLQAWRLHLAAQRLRETDDAVGTIAAAAGYDSPSAFARAFRRRLGAAPVAFRAAGR
jgi:AraC-like DNA-binding protein